MIVSSPSEILTEGLKNTLKQYQESIQWILYKKTVLGTSHIIRKVLQCETWSLRVVGCSIGLKGEVPGERKPVIRDDNNNSIKRIPTGESDSRSAGNQNFINVLTRARHWTLPWATWNECTLVTPYVLKILSCHLLLGLSSGLFFQMFLLIYFVNSPSLPRILHTTPSHIILVDLITLIISGKAY